MKEQKVLVLADEPYGIIQRKVDEILEQGWMITSVSTQHVAGSSGQIRGGYFIIFERYDRT
jgi:hypothetical protein